MELHGFNNEYRYVESLTPKCNQAEECTGGLGQIYRDFYTTSRLRIDCNNPTVYELWGMAEGSNESWKETAVSALRRLVRAASPRGSYQSE